MTLHDWKRVLVFGAHVDDEIIGPGGTIARLAAQGAQVTVVTFTGSDEDTGYARVEWKESVGEMRRQEAGHTDRILGIHQRVFLGLPVQEVVNDRPTYQQCVRIIREIRPHVILTHYRHDKHRDHRAVSEITDEARWKAAEAVLADLGEPWYTPELYYYEIFELFTSPSIVVDITDYFEQKLRAMESQVTQLEVLPGIEQYIRGLAEVRGFSCQTQYAEAFLRSNLLPTLM